MNRSSILSSAIVGVLVLVLAACSTGGKVTGTKETAAGTQTETDATVAYDGKTARIVVAYNDETNEQQYIAYTSSDRTVHRGASLMGWSYSDDQGGSWSYGGKVAPPSQWSVLWGDPAVTTSRARYSVVFMSNLAVPRAKFPKGGIRGYFYYGDGRESYIGGACLAKSVDGGKTFANYQCLTNKTNVPDVPDSPLGNFYDGGSMASDSEGAVYASYTDVATGQIDVWRSPNENGSFQMLPAPFPNLVAASHPLLRPGPDGALYVAAQEVGGTDPNGNQLYYVYMNRYVNGSWNANPVRVSGVSALYPDVRFGTTLLGSELTVRTAQQFGYDIGSSSPGGDDAIRLLYTTYDSTGHLYVEATACSADLSSCNDVPGWKFQGQGPGNSAIDVYDPDVTAFVGTIGFAPTWQASWDYHWGSESSTNVSRTTLGYLANGNAFIFPIDIIQNAPVCSDERGYWGDYDAFILAGFNQTRGVWMRFLTDSSAGCTERWGFTADAQHLQESSYTY
ncbi:MAG TPA: hypothetical protein VFO25_08355 [Candidatus Eremiobacteraceae bacterium]|nr:hypothetical protein [Candidatus Eremiobacteraceae bacterium]